MATPPTPKPTDSKPKPHTDPQPTDAQRATFEPVDTSEKRMFQTGKPGAPDGREALTKDEARAQGFHWLDAREDHPKHKKE